jgi:lipoate-protein ligase A
MIKNKEHTSRYIESGIGTAQWNMAVDEALLYSFDEDSLPIFRIYGWETALSFGRFSKPRKSIDMDRMEREGISCVRRITGGGILVHGDDLSYALILPRTFVKKKGVKESYRYLCGFLIRLYENLGLSAGFAHDFQAVKKSTDICLAGNEAYDILIGGKKIGGNAQRHTAHAVLQHGTIPLSLDRELFEVLFLKESGLEDAATLQEENVTITYKVLKESAVRAFSEIFNAKIEKDHLQPDEMVLAQKLLSEKYSNRAWNIDAEDTLQQA